MTVTRAAGPVLIVKGKTWKHNAAKLSLTLRDEPQGSTLLMMSNATTHLGPGAGRLERDLVDALRSAGATQPWW